MKEITFRVKDVELLLSDGADELFLHLDAPTTYPSLNLPATMQINTSHGYGEQWARENVGMPVTIKDIRTPKNERPND